MEAVFAAGSLHHRTEPVLSEITNSKLNTLSIGAFFLICLNWLFYGITCKKWTTFKFARKWLDFWTYGSALRPSSMIPPPQHRWQLRHPSGADKNGGASPTWNIYVHHFLMKSWFPWVHETTCNWRSLRFQAYTFHCLRYLTGLPDFHPSWK